MLLNSLVPEAVPLLTQRSEPPPSVKQSFPLAEVNLLVPNGTRAISVVPAFHPLCTGIHC